MVYSQILINSILLGGIYASIAVGFSLVWGVMNILNILHGTFLMLGGYVTFWMFKLYGVDPFLSLPISAVTMFCAGYVAQRGLINKIVRAPMFMSLILTFGLQLLVVRLAIYFFTGDFRSVQPSYAGFPFPSWGFPSPSSGYPYSCWASFSRAFSSGSWGARARAGRYARRGWIWTPRS